MSASSSSSLRNCSEITSSFDNTLPLGESGSRARRGFAHDALPGRYRVRPSQREGDLASGEIQTPKLFPNKSLAAQLADHFVGDGFDKRFLVDAAGLLLAGRFIHRRWCGKGSTLHA